MKNSIMYTTSETLCFCHLHIPRLPQKMISFSRQKCIYSIFYLVFEKRWTVSKEKIYQIIRLNCNLREVLQSLDVSFQTVHPCENHVPRKKVTNLTQIVHIRSSTQLLLKVCGTRDPRTMWCSLCSFDFLKYFTRRLF